ncbi:MAG: helix-turn-helix domain-containing protein [Actinobacteria bacterium]|nr:helix-turn-helix domain-containing protein [Actinomycetota bacterium]
MPEINWLAPFTALPQKRPKVPKGTKGRILNHAQRLIEALDVEIESIRLCRIRLLLLGVILTIFENWIPPKLVGGATNASFTRINSAIEMTLGSSRLVTTEETARACNINRKTFSWLFREMMGIHYSEFNLRHRINKAAEQLLRTDDPLKRIAKDWGFVDVSHLHNCFMNHYNCSPKEYRQQSEA